MDPASGPSGRGRGRGRGSQRVEDEFSESASVSSQRSEGSEGTRDSGVASRGRGRGGRVVQHDPVLASLDPSPVSLPENPEEDDFLAAFRRLQERGTIGRGRGRGFSFSSCPSPSVVSETGDSGVASRSGIALPPVTPRFRESSESYSRIRRAMSPGEPAEASESIGNEDYSELEKATVIKRGEKGRRVPVVANFLRLNIAENMGIYEYHVDFEPAVESFRWKQNIIRSLAEALGPARNFDGAKLYLSKTLFNKISIFEVNHPNNSEEQITVKIKLVKKNSLADCVHFYNILFRRVMEQLGMTEMKRHHYDHRVVYDVPQHKLEIWPGYVTAVDELEGGLLLCCDSSFRVVRTCTVLDVWDNYQNMGNGDRNLQKEKFKEYILSKIVLTRYNNRQYRIDDIDWNQTPKSTFTNSRGQEITFYQYYQTAYNISIKDMTQPLLVHRPKPKQQVGCIPLILLVPELCFVSGMDSTITSNYTIMKDLAAFTRLTPQQRNLALQKFVSNINDSPEALSKLSRWGLSLEDALVKLEGRVLTIPQICLNRNFHFHPESANFGDKVLSNSIFDPVPVRNGLLLFTQYDRDKAFRMIEIYRQVARPFGIAFSFNEGQAISVGRGSIKDFQSALEKHLNPQIQFVVAIFPSARDDLYRMIKRMCTLNRPVPSQVILSKTLGNERKIRSVMQKIVLQINCKLGGSLWTIRIPLPEKIMFVGMDVYHDPKRRDQSVTAVVASLNPIHTKYYSRVIFQQRHQETVNSLLPILMDTMVAFAEESGGYPDRVVVWRDGVSDGQLSFTKSHEVSQITEVFQNLSINPKFTFCVVQKRINARLFLQGSHNSSSCTNPEPGTVVDHTITRKYLYDFYLVSQLVREGTVTPTHFVVLEDNADTPPDLIQKFAFANSFMYYNWLGSIRVPAMCQYAHKLASLVGQHIQAEPSMKVAKTLYFL